jgi:hypothetical protein
MSGAEKFLKRLALSVAGLIGCLALAVPAFGQLSLVSSTPTATAWPTGSR